jgi:hypothetical protein
MEKSTILRTFNTHFFEFLEDVSSAISENEVLTSAIASFKLIKKLNPTTIIKVWYLQIYGPYVAEVERGDIAFIYEKDYQSDIGTLSNAGDIMKSIDALREPIRSMSDTNKGHTVKYIQNLSKLSSMYHNSREPTVPCYNAGSFT